LTLLGGIDEAGLGPSLGPLVVAGALLRVPPGWTPSTPWEALGAVLHNGFRKRDPRLSVCDSKVLHARGGLDALEESILAFAACLNALPDGTPGLASRSRGCRGWLERLGDREALLSLEAHPWYAEDGWPEVPDGPHEELAQALTETEAGLERLSARTVLEGPFNQAIQDGLNKSDLLLSRTGALLVEMVEAAPDEALCITIDKQGGRGFYHPLLTRLFPGAWIDILREEPAGSIYRLRRDGGNDVEIEFRPKADGSAFCVALASMLAKFLRERFMADLNRFFAARLPGLKPTAGYYVDAQRFLKEVAGILDTEGIERDRFVRCR
jgi:hypothetical protein